MGTIDLNQLGVFVAVAETAGFSSAARRLGVPKSSVSRSIARLEAALGVQLIHRTTRRVALSSAGAALFQRISPLLGSLRDSLAELPELGAEPSGTLRVTAPVDFGAAVLGDVVARFAARHPDVRVELRLTNEFLDLVSEGVDLAVRIATKRLRDSSLYARAVGAVRSQLVAAPAYLAARAVPRTPAELAGHEWVLFRGPALLRLEGPSAVHEVPARGRVVCDDLSFVRALARAGAGIAALPSYLADGDVAAGRLVRLLPRWSLPGGTVWLVSPSKRHVPRKVAAFRELLLEQLNGG
jgi:DNA-binding transcriptional LysR family regulator